MRSGTSVFRPIRWIAGSGLLLLVTVWFATACGEAQPAPPPQQPEAPAAAPTAVPIEASAPATRVAPQPAPTASLPPPTVAPMMAPTTPTPVPRPTRAPSTAVVAPSPTPVPQAAVPTPAPTETAAQPEADSVAIVWGDVFKQLTMTEQDCLDSALGKDRLLDIVEKPISPEEPEWGPEVIGCLTPDTAMAFPGAMMFSLMVNEVLLGDAGQGEITPEARECIQQLLADTDVGAVIAAALQDPASGQMPNRAVMDFAMGIEMCAPSPAGAMPPGGTTVPPTGDHPPLPIEATLWQFSVPGWAMTAPTVSDGRVYVGADDGSVYALDAANGAPLWTFETGDVVRSPAVVSGGVVYAGSNDNVLYALDAATGDLLWQHDTGSPVQYAPLVGDDAVYVPTMSEGGRKIHTLDASSGTELWVAPQYYPFDTGWESGIGAAFAGDTLLMIDDQGGLQALNAQTGESVWSFRGEVGTDTPPVVIGDVVYVTAVNTAHALDIVTGEELWKFSTGMFPARGFPPLIDGDMYFFAPDLHIYGLDIATGEQAWIFGLDSMASTAPVASEGTVYVASEDGLLYAFDPATGLERWIGMFLGNMLQSLEVAEGIMYLESSDGYLLALDVTTGQVLWGFNKGFFSGVRTYTVSDGVVYISSLNGAIYAIDAAVAAGR